MPAGWSRSSASPSGTRPSKTTRGSSCFASWTCGFLEAVYQEALQIELARRSVPFVPFKQLRIGYKEVQLRKGYVADLVCFGEIIVELKA